MTSLIFLSLLSCLFVSCTNQTKQPTYLLLFNQRTEDTSKIYSMYPDGSHITQIAELPTFSPYWLSPTGTNLAYLVGSKLSIFDNAMGKVVADVDEVGSSVSEEFVDDVVWSPLGDKLVYVSDSEGKQGTDLWLYDLTTGSKIPLTNDESVELEPAWSTDAQRIAFVHHKACDGNIWNCPLEQQYWDIETINVNSLTRQTVTDFKSSGLIPSGNRSYARLCNLLWSPDDTYIIFENSCNQIGLQWWKQVFVVSTNDSNLTQLTHFSEYETKATQFPVSIFLYSTQWVSTENTLLISYTEVELIENGKINYGLLLISENDFFDTTVEGKSSILSSAAKWSPNREHVIGNATSIFNSLWERPFIGQLHGDEVVVLASATLPYGSCGTNSVYWSQDSHYVAFAANKQGNQCLASLQEGEDIVVVSVSGTDVISNVISLNGANQPIGWLTLP